MRALGHVKVINGQFCDLYEITDLEKMKHYEDRLEFLDFPGKIEVFEGDRFFNWYWVPLKHTEEEL